MKQPTIDQLTATIVRLSLQVGSLEKELDLSERACTALAKTRNDYGSILSKIALSLSYTGNFASMPDVILERL